MDAIMKRIDFDITPQHEPTRTRSSPTQVALVLGAACLALVLFASAASAGEHTRCDKVKTGRTGQTYAFKDDC